MYFISFIVKMSSKSVLIFRERSFTKNINNLGHLTLDRYEIQISQNGDCCT